VSTHSSPSPHAPAPEIEPARLADGSDLLAAAELALVVSCRRCAFRVVLSLSPRTPLVDVLQRGYTAHEEARGRTGEPPCTGSAAGLSLKLNDGF
jgi:hypothetical protein